MSENEFFAESRFDVTALEELWVGFLLLSCIISVPKPTACLLILMLEKILSVIHFDLVDNIGHRVHSVIPAFSFEKITIFKSSLCYHSAYLLRKAMC